MKRKNFITIGTFDGLHRGHQAVIRRLLALARRRGMDTRVVMFEVPPRLFFHPHVVPRLLTTAKERVELLRGMGVGGVKALRFDRSIAVQTPRAFFENVLVKGMNAGGVLVGSDFCFGKDRAGTVQTLAELCREKGLAFEAEELVCRGPAKVSSTRVRVLLETGRVERARRLLGRPFVVGGRVVAGRGLGSKLGFPTANLKVPPEKLLPPGVFAGRAHWDGKSRAAAVNIGTKPTVEAAGRLSVEVHLPGFKGDLRGKVLRVELLRRLRSEKKFASVDALKAQVAKDVRRAEAFAS
jgi:riboflavin kinase/FMN adenylyltransferase